VVSAVTLANIAAASAAQGAVPDAATAASVALPAPKANASTVAEATIDERLIFIAGRICDTVAVVAAFHSADHSRSRKHTAGDVRLELAAVGDGGGLRPIAARARHGARAGAIVARRQFKTLEEWRRVR